MAHSQNSSAIDINPLAPSLLNTGMTWCVQIESESLTQSILMTLTVALANDAKNSI